MVELKDELKLVQEVIENMGTKYCLKVLKYLYEHPNARQADIAREFKIPPSNLQVSMNKIRQATPELIRYSDRNSKGLVLTELAKEYVEYVNEEKDVFPSKMIHEWVELNGKRAWKERMKLVLDYIVEPDSSEKRILDEIVAYIIKNDIRECHELCEEFDDEILFEQLSNYAIQQQREKYVELLTDVYRSDWETAYRLVDYIFEYAIYDDKEELDMVYKSFDLPNEAVYIEIKEQIKRIVIDCYSIKDRKRAIYEAVQCKMDNFKPLAFYLAEKIVNGREKIHVNNLKDKVLVEVG